ncbi:hypothetical protein GEV33_014187 [Tenebrio molitor]|uniref:Uncharacterized protein n=1 Tax=Tenebrio molitor TaxID=7067 RepID=A0A8J6H5R4_TENMO|nr:hypothetical protein GEV33_014187 [Tenebrio molitor]
MRCVRFGNRSNIEEPRARERGFNPCTAKLVDPGGLLLICPRRSTILFPTCAFVPRPTRRDALSQVTTDDAHHARTCRAGGRRRHDDGIKRSTLRRSAPPSERVTSTRRDSSLRGRLPRYRLLLVLQLLHACSIAFLRNDSGAPLRAVSLIAATDNSCLLCALGTQDVYCIEGRGNQPLRVGVSVVKSRMARSGPNYNKLSAVRLRMIN